MPAPSAVLLGRLERQFLIPPNGRARVDQPGGNLLYAASAFRLWAGSVGLVARVGQDIPETWLAKFEELGLDVQGIKILSAEHDLRSFTAYDDTQTPLHDHPIPYFAKLGLPFPKALLTYKYDPPTLSSARKRSELSLRPEDLPAAYSGTQAAHLCPMDFFSHTLMPAALRAAGINSITLESSPSYMHPSLRNEIANLVSGLEVFLTNEQQLRILFSGRTEDIWEMAERIVSLNCRAVVIQRGSRGLLLLDGAAGTRYQIPPYPSRPKDPTHNQSSFAGGFLASLISENGDFLQATLRATATASLAAESSGAFSVLDSLQGLAESRAQTLARAVQLI
ncbi:MAG: carbohydrate kinase family protein [Chloroflexi bacterium]|nr:carbohydrate kinase family protein [Chloroflexota bacterium]MQC25951.1 carbohydrate kinase family protein [Chloroflexota bacterium]